MEALLDPISQEYDLNGSSSSAALGLATACDRSHLATILAFLNREIDQSAAILRDLARSLSAEFCALSETDDQETIRQRMLTSTMALQNEDRVQQRLRDLRAVLSLLEHALHIESPATGTDLDHAIIDRFDLEEIRIAFAQSVGMVSALPSASSSVKTPSLGDVDLF